MQTIHEECQQDELDAALGTLTRGTAQLRREILQLKSEKADLQARVKVLGGAVKALMRQSGLLPTSPRSEPVRWSDLPLEIIQRIFEYTVGSDDLYDPSVIYGAHSPWLKAFRLKKGLQLVCKASYWAGVYVVYQDIVFRRMGQISALANTLRTHPQREELACWIKGIHMVTCPIWHPCADVLLGDLSFIVLKCPSLRTFSFRPHLQFPILDTPPSMKDYDGWYNPTWLFESYPARGGPLLKQALGTTLTSLEIASRLDGPSIVKLHNLLGSASALRSLIIGPLSSDFRFPSELAPENLTDRMTLPSLERLELPFGSQSEYDNYIVSWILPHLSHLTILVFQDALSVMKIIEQFGARLRYLQVFPLKKLLELDGFYYGLVTICPVLEHLIVPSFRRIEWGIPSINLRSPTLRQLDLWVDMWRWNDILLSPSIHSAILSAATEAPQLKTVRAVCTHFANTVVDDVRGAIRSPDWPTLCHSDILRGPHDIATHELSLTRLIQTSVAVLPDTVWQKMERDHRRRSDWPEAYAQSMSAVRAIMEEDAGGRVQRRPSEANRVPLIQQTSESEDEDEDEEDANTDDEDDSDNEYVGGDNDEDSGESVSVKDSPSEVLPDEGGDSEVSDVDDEGDLEIPDGDDKETPDLNAEEVLEAFCRSTEAYSHIALWNL